MQSESIRVLVADDHAIVRKGIRALLETEPDIVVVGEAREGMEAITQALKLSPDVILMDLVMPCVDGLEAIERITAYQPGARILVLTSFAGDDKVFPAIRAGALGYLLKDSGPEQLVRAIHEVHRGESSLHPSIARKLLMSRPGDSRQEMLPDLLTPREAEVLHLVARALSNREISEQLGISEATTRSHVSSLLTKLKLDSRTQVAVFALREGLVPLHESSTLSTACRPPNHEDR